MYWGLYQYIKWGIIYECCSTAKHIMRSIVVLLLCSCVYGQRRNFQEEPQRQNFQVQRRNFQAEPQRQNFQAEPQRNFQDGESQNFQGVPFHKPEDQNLAANQNQLRFQGPPAPPIHVQENKIAATPIPIIRLNKQQSLDGSYKTSYETGNSIVAEETGFVKNLGVKGSEGLVQYGSYSYTDPDGQVITVRYTADEGGFRAEGAHLPTPPPIPAEIQKGLDIIFESIRQQAQNQAQNKHARNTQLESSNYPENQEDDGSYRPEHHNQQ